MEQKLLHLRQQKARVGKTTEDRCNTTPKITFKKMPTLISYNTMKRFTPLYVININLVTFHSGGRMSWVVLTAHMTPRISGSFDMIIFVNFVSLPLFTLLT